MTEATLWDRFESKVIRTEDGCWGWAGGTNRDRPYLWMDGRVQTAYRASWVLHRGPIPAGMLVCHTCDNGICCNPDHLFLGTYQDNARDAVSKGRHAFGTKMPNARLNPDKVRYIRQQRALGRSQQSIADELGVVRGTVEFVDQGKTWKEVS